MSTLLIECEQGSEEWLQARAGVITASRFGDARSRVGGLTDQQKIYVNAIMDGATEAQAMRDAGYKAKPSSETIKRALAGEPVDRPSDVALKYAQLLAIERIAGKPLDDTYVTWAMRRGRELEPIARALYEERTGTIIETAGLVVTTDRLFGYSTDGVALGGQGGIEVKVPAASDKVAGIWLDPEPVIAEYLDQIDGGIWLNRWQWVDLVVYTPWLESIGKELFIHRITRDEVRIERLEADLIEFSRIVSSYEHRLRGGRVAAPIAKPEF